MDRNFTGKRSDEVRIAALFDACRTLGRQVESLRFRLAIRPNTWSVLKRNHEGLSHVEQYTCTLTWSEEDILSLLARRVEGYLLRHNMQAGDSSLPQHERKKELVSLVFETPVHWGTKVRPIHVPLYTLCQHRPRWLIELSRVASRHAARASKHEIQLSDLLGTLSDFGTRRLQDTAAEFKPQCPQIEELLDGFRGQTEQYTTASLLSLIQNRILNHVSPKLPDVFGKPSHRDVAAFLFQIGFLFARKDYDDGSYEHIGYTQQPTLLVSRTDLDSGCTWEIPPVFRQALDLRTDEGFERPLNQKTAPKAPPKKKRGDVPLDVDHRSGGRWV